MLPGNHDELTGMVYLLTYSLRNRLYSRKLNGLDRVVSGNYSNHYEKLCELCAGTRCDAASLVYAYYAK